MVRKTTILLREDVYQALREEAGARNLSSLVNKILMEHFLKKESMFGVMRPVDISELRDHRDRI